MESKYERQISSLKATCKKVSETDKNEEKAKEVPNKVEDEKKEEPVKKEEPEKKEEPVKKEEGPVKDPDIKCWTQGDCEPGFMDITGGNTFFWSCGLKCEIPKRVDGSCTCACLRQKQRETKYGTYYHCFADGTFEIAVKPRSRTRD